MKFTRSLAIRTILTLAIVTVVTLYGVADPATTVWMPKCIFHELTGWRCPGCGSQRLLHALLHGRLAEAWHYNAFIIIFIPVIGALVWVDAMRLKRPSLYAAVYRPWLFVAVAVAIVLWTVLRNMSGV